MYSFARSIKIFLMDGNPNERLMCELSNWTGKVYRIPKTLVKKSIDRQELLNAGVYMLVGKDPDDPEKNMVYIGESENIYERLCNHIDGKEFWTECLVIISKDENLNKAHIKFLEDKFYKLAIEVGRYKIDNSNKPAVVKISEPDIAEMEEFSHNVKLIVNALGYKMFEFLNITTSEEQVKTFCMNYKNSTAYGRLSTEGFVVLKGSSMLKEPLQSFKQAYLKLRNSLIENKIVELENDKYVFSNDYLFSSPSLAGSIIAGTSINGRIYWKMEDGTTLKDYQAQ